MFNTSIAERDPSAGFNGSFEKIIHGLPANWTIYAASDYQKNYYLSFDTLFVKDGKQSLKFEVLSVDTSNINQAWRRPGLNNRIDGTEGDIFKVSFWIKNSGCKFKIKIGVPGSDMNSKDIINTKKDFTEWTYFEQDYTVQDHLPFFRFELNILSPGTFWIDDVQIKKIEN
jgi:hypothetical protein